eukprot:m51a1_g13969 putative ubiquitin carboxyl-terminal hydrolase isozyme l3 (678) ;mRNA; r:981810-987957
MAARQMRAVSSVPEGWSSADQPSVRESVDRRGHKCIETTLTVFWVPTDHLSECAVETGWMVVARGPRHTTFDAAWEAVRSSQFGKEKGHEFLCCYDNQGNKVRGDLCIGESQKFRVTFTSRKAPSCSLITPSPAHFPPRARSSRPRRTRDDLILAAFQGPVLGLSSAVVHQYRTFTAELLVRHAWLEARGLAPSDVAAAALGARVCRPGALSADPLECPKCGRVLDVRPLGPGVSSVEWDKPVGEAVPASGADWSPRAEAELPGGLESFRLALRTRCTSSRQHLKCPTLVLVVVLGPGLAVCSEPFAVYARHAARHLRSAPDDSDAEATGPAMLLDEAVSVAPVPTGALEPRSPPLGSVLFLSSYPVMAVGVRIVSVSISREDGLKIGRSLVPLLLERIPGGLLLQKKSTLAGGVVIIVLGFRTREELEKGMNIGAIPPMSEQHWTPLESNPEVLTKYIRNLGVENAEFADVMGFDEELLAFVPKPVFAALLLFPITHNYEENRIAEDRKLGKAKTPVNPNVFFVNQTIENACGTIGCIHAVLNSVGENGVRVTKGSFFDTYRETSRSLPAPERAKALEKSDQLEQAHSAAATEGQTEAPDEDEVIVLHFVAFVCVDGTLYELDGRRPQPMPRGPTTRETLLRDAGVAIQKIMAADPDELRFTTLALVGQQTSPASE